MKRRVLLVPGILMCALLLVGCGRDYRVIGRVVVADPSLKLRAGILELTGKPFPAHGLPIAAATVKLMLDCDPEGRPLEKSSPWKTVTTDADGRFQIQLYGPASEKLCGALIVEASNYALAKKVYWERMEPDEQTFLVVLSPAV